jgi:hypothetical protein
MGVLHIDPEPARDRQPIGWLIDRLSFGETVGAWMPDDFERYARILHPAKESWVGEGQRAERPVRWSEIAGWSGKQLSSASSMRDLQQRADGATWRDARPHRSMPAEGQLPSPERDRFLDLLARETSSPDRLWLLTWSGWGDLPRRHAREAMVLSKDLTRSGRSYIPYTGAIRPGTAQSHRQSDFPSFWWPNDRAWFVSTDVDFVSTYVGGSNELVTALLADDVLEVFEATLTDPHDGGRATAADTQTD